MKTDNVRIAFELEPDMAWEYAQFLKRVCRESFRQYARNEEETQRMVDASELSGRPSPPRDTRRGRGPVAASGGASRPRVTDRERPTA